MQQKWPRWPVECVGELAKLKETRIRMKRKQGQPGLAHYLVETDEEYQVRIPSRLFQADEQLLFLLLFLDYPHLSFGLHLPSRISSVFFESQTWLGDRGGWILFFLIANSIRSAHKEYIGKSPKGQLSSSSQSKGECPGRLEL